MVPEFSMFLGFFSAIVLDWTNPTQQKIAKVINFHPILTKILVSVFYTVKSAHLNSPIFKRNFLAIYKGNTQIFLLHRVQQVSKYLLSRLHKGSDRFLKNQGPTGGDPLSSWSSSMELDRSKFNYEGKRVKWLRNRCGSH